MSIREQAKVLFIFYLCMKSFVIASQGNHEASTEATGPGFQRERAAGQTSSACTSLQGMAPACHPERSEGSVWMGGEMLRCAQQDRAVLLPRQRPSSS
jgi:hypothetical protein